MASVKLEQWRALFMQADKIKQRKPWLRFRDVDWLALQLNDYKEPFYLTIMGSGGEGMGIGMYYGNQGLSDLLSILDTESFYTPYDYLMGNINCIGCYFGNRNDLSDDQYKLIKDLGLSYRGKNQWTHFVSYESGYVMAELSNKEASQCTKVLTFLNKVLDWIDDHPECMEHIRKEEVTFFSETDGELIPEYRDLPFSQARYMTVYPEDEELNYLNSFPETDMEVVLDLNYLFTAVDDPTYHKPINPLMLVVYDLKNDLVLSGTVISPDEDRLDVLFSFLAELIENCGRPAKLYLRNPFIYFGLEDICDKLHIEMVIDPLDELDDLFEFLQENL